MPTMNSTPAIRCSEHMPAATDQRMMNDDSRYSVGGKTFLIERVFRDDSSETVGTVLLKLLRMDTEE